VAEQKKRRRKPMSHNAAGLQGPAPPKEEVKTLWKRLKRLGTLLSTEEVFDADGSTTRRRMVRRARRM
jgi:hypothetical protein